MSGYNPAWGAGQGGGGSVPAPRSTNLTPGALPRSSNLTPGALPRSPNLTPRAPSSTPRENPRPRVQNLDGSMGKLSLSSSSHASPSLLANHFEIQVGTLRQLYRYELTFRKLNREDYDQKLQMEENAMNRPAPDPAGTSTDPDPESTRTSADPASASTSTNPGIGPAKKRRIVWLAMERLQQWNRGKALATDYSTEVISSGEIEIQSGNDNDSGSSQTMSMQIEYFDEYQRGPRPDCEVFEVALSGPVILSLDQLLDFLSIDTPHVNATNYRRREETIKALNTIFSYRPYRRCFPALTPHGVVQNADLTTVNGHKFYGIMRVSAAGATSTSDTGKPLEPRPGFGLDAIAGFARSVRAVISQRGRLYLNINTATAVFYQQGTPNTLQALIERLKRGYHPHSPWDDPVRHSLVNFLKGIRVRTTYLGGNDNDNDNFIGMVTDLAGARRPDQDPFPRNCTMVFPDLQSNQTVADYFQTRHPDARVGNSSREMVVVLGEGDFRKTIPAGCLEIIPGQMNRNIAEKPKAGVRSPSQNKALIFPAGREVFFVSDRAQPGAGQFGFDLATRMVSVPIVRLEQPNLRYRQQRRPGSQATSLPERRLGQDDLQLLKYGAWNLKDRSFVKPASGFHWTYVELAVPAGETCDSLLMTAFGNSLAQQLQRSGMTQLQLVRPGPGPGHGHTYHLSRPRPRPYDEAGIKRQYGMIKELLTELKQKRGVRLVVFLLRDKDTELYSAIKRAGDQDVGIATVCHVLGWDKRKQKRQLTPKDSPDFFGNLSMKVNLKLDVSAVNQALDQKGKGPILTHGTMVLGIDVTHPGTAAIKGAPSVAAVVGSVDAEFAQWPASLHVNDVDVQLRRSEGGGGGGGGRNPESNERVVHLAHMVYERLRDYHRRNHSVPNRLVVYRDGLSESQFDMCTTMELPAIGAGVALLLQQLGVHVEATKMPPIILICAVKRHNTRLFPETDAPNDDVFVGYGGSASASLRPGAPYNYNPLPGTLVTSEITYGEGRDFFLISQKAIQGTARPTHYVILENQSDFTRHDIAQMTHNLCYLFGRATRSVGVCPAAYYADLAADRARCYLRNVYHPVSKTDFDPEQYALNLAVHDDLKNTMFYI
ncbi:hypothetical protein A1O3_04323 [Capronia epimyces CBS 606.96]|uniref:Piwi domain-containing protein n=1 Tax=Capronia epimyces CBS 606.96 TaxID=1182542 RepID=W9YYK9_9EURO|nr:uncharacterized protein A1O3_04323 [Capronia epimyces CBS 606.96]EXJ87364.1 hypothetical protein A1O3_04323 [Capronia epimyces CBS 606.96]